MTPTELLTEVRTLQAAVDRLVLAVAAHQPAPLTPLRPTAERAAKACIRLVALRLRVPEVEIRGRSRESRIQLARHLAVFLTRELSGDTLEAVGRVFHRDHGTIAHSIETLRSRCETERDTAEIVAALLQQLREAFHQDQKPEATDSHR